MGTWAQDAWEVGGSDKRERGREGLGMLKRSQAFETRRIVRPSPRVGNAEREVNLGHIT